MSFRKLTADRESKIARFKAKKETEKKLKVRANYDHECHDFIFTPDAFITATCLPCKQKLTTQLF